MFTYDFTNGPQVASVRLLIGDTVDEGHVWEDEEIVGAYRIQQSTFQSGPRYNGTAGASLPSSPVSYFRVAAILLCGAAANKSRRASITRLLDVQLAPDKAAAALLATAREYRTVDSESGAFVIIEQCTTSFGFRDRFLKTVQRETAGV